MRSERRVEENEAEPRALCCRTRGRGWRQKRSVQASISVRQLISLLLAGMRTNCDLYVYLDPAAMLAGEASL